MRKISYSADAAHFQDRHMCFVVRSLVHEPKRTRSIMLARFTLYYIAHHVTGFKRHFSLTDISYVSFASHSGRHLTRIGSLRYP